MLAYFCGLRFQRQFNFQRLCSVIFTCLVYLVLLGLPPVPAAAARESRRSFPRPGCPGSLGRGGGSQARYGRRALSLAACYSWASDKLPLPVRLHLSVTVSGTAVQFARGINLPGTSFVGQVCARHLLLSSFILGPQTN